MLPNSHLLSILFIEAPSSQMLLLAVGHSSEAIFPLSRQEICAPHVDIPPESVVNFAAAQDC